MAAQFMGVLSLGVIVGAVIVWFIEPTDKVTITPSPAPTKSPNDEGENPNKQENFTEVKDIPVGTFKYGGSTSWAFLYPTLELEIKQVHPQFNINVDPNLIKGSGIGIQRLIDGKLDFAIASRGVNSDEESLAKIKGFALKSIPIASSGLAVAVNPNLNIEKLSKEELRKIYSGEITNWKETSAIADIKIKPYLRGNNHGSTEEFRKLLGIPKFGENIGYVNTTSEKLQKVAREPGAILHGPISDVVPQCGIKTLPLVNDKGEIFYPYQQKNFVLPAQCSSSRRNRVNLDAIYSSEYPLPVTFHVIVKQNGQREEQVGQAYANLLRTKQGQDIIKKLQETGNFNINLSNQ
jgi:phosphate transport system substrate-binding protein